METRKDKIKVLSTMYRRCLMCNESISFMKTFNEIIIESVGMSGLKKIKDIAWKKSSQCVARGEEKVFKNFVSDIKTTKEQWGKEWISIEK